VTSGTIDIISCEVYSNTAIEQPATMPMVGGSLYLEAHRGHSSSATTKRASHSKLA